MKIITLSEIKAVLPSLELIPAIEEGFVRYSARDVAVRRAQLQLCPVVLGTATPSLETLHNARSGRYGWLRLREPGWRRSAIGSSSSASTPTPRPTPASARA